LANPPPTRQWESIHLDRLGGDMLLSWPGSAATCHSSAIMVSRAASMDTLPGQHRWTLASWPPMDLGELAASTESFIGPSWPASWASCWPMAHLHNP
jgi:hypothetical protein